MVAPRAGAWIETPWIGPEPEGLLRSINQAYDPVVVGSPDDEQNYGVGVIDRVIWRGRDSI